MGLNKEVQTTQLFYTPPRNYGKTYYFTHYWGVTLHDELKTRVKGNVYVDIQVDAIVVTIHNKLGTPFRYTLENIQSEIVRGLDVKVVAENIVKLYKKYILNQFFM